VVRQRRWVTWSSFSHPSEPGSSLGVWWR